MAKESNCRREEKIEVQSTHFTKAKLVLSNATAKKEGDAAQKATMPAEAKITTRRGQKPSTNLQRADKCSPTAQFSALHWEDAVIIHWEDEGKENKIESETVPEKEETETCSCLSAFSYPGIRVDATDCPV